VGNFAGRYELGPVIGRGGMADVHAARDGKLDRPVALKLLRPEFYVQPLVRSRFEAEARLAARLSHPNVVSVFDSGEADGVPYIVMERLPGVTLSDRLAEGPLDEDEVRLIGTEVLAALSVAHAAGIVHRDIKPANVLATGDGHWKVGDFGIAKALEVDTADATIGVVLGTPAYLAPERLLGSPATVASDVFSVGVILYEALAGRRPFERNGTAVIADGAPPSLTAIRPKTDPALAAAVDRSLAAEPSQRYWSAAEMGANISPRSADDALRPTVAWAPAAAGGRGEGGGGGGGGGGDTRLLPAGEIVPPRRKPRSAAALAALTVVLLAAAGLAVAAGVDGGHSAHPPPSTTVAPTTATTVPATTTPTTLLTVKPPGHGHHHGDPASITLPTLPGGDGGGGGGGGDGG
jgi:hypothetical protein